MNRTVQYLERQASVLQQRLSGERRPLGLLLGVGCPLAVGSKGRSVRAEKPGMATSANNRAERALRVAEAFSAFTSVIRTRSRRDRDELMVDALCEAFAGVPVLSRYPP